MSDFQAIPLAMEWHPGLSIYASPAFLQSVSDEFGWLGGVDGAGRLRCLLPYTIVRRATVRMVRFRLETIGLGDTLSLGEERSFLNSVVEYFRPRADIIIPATTNTIFRTAPDGAVTAPYGSMVLDLSEGEPALWQQIHSKHRNVIRNAEKKGVQVRMGGEHLQTAYQLVRDTFRRSKLPFMTASAFRQTIEALGDNVKIFLAEHQGKPQGCAVIPYSSYAAYYVYGGSAGEGVINGAMNFLQWEAIRFFRNLGVGRYDFVGVRLHPDKGSKAEGLYMFKQRFGGRLVQGCMWKYPLRPLKAAVYSLAVRLLRGGDLVDVERRRLGPGEPLSAPAFPLAVCPPLAARPPAAPQPLAGPRPAARSVAHG